MELLEVAQAAVDQPRRARRRPGRDVVLLDERGPHPARDGVEQGAAPDDPAADDDDVPGLSGERVEIGPAALERVWVPCAGVAAGGSIIACGGPGGRREMRHRARPCRRSGR